MEILQQKYPLYLANEAYQPNTDLVVYDKFTGQVATKVALADSAIIEQAIEAADTAREPMAAMASFEKQEVLMHCVKRFQERFDELALSLCIEAGKPIK